MKKIYLITIIAVSLMAFSVSANRRFNKFKGGKGSGMGMDRSFMGMKGMRGMKGMKGHKGFHRDVLSKVLLLQHILKLDKVQMHKLMKLNIKFKIKKLQYKKIIAPLRIQLRILNLKDVINLQKIRNLMIKVSKFIINKKMLKLQKQIEFERVLRPEQKFKLRYMLAMGHGKNLK
jgi:hypothetical protein